MSPLQLDEVFEEPPSVVSTILCTAIEAAGWTLVGVWDAGQRLVWTVDDDQLSTPATIQAVISDHADGGSRVHVSSLDQLWRGDVQDPRLRSTPRLDDAGSDDPGTR
ncbi:hypothetical protein ASG49_06375 [Marmoricola sp. Leaf446]|uniref:hypothetical protein n=1 Tax=Marmoricola sp. Leaf446 TaxID=1736379 RepID=UPI000701310F|nr:hypothetical protein [Marmoricola sp. Leaf446]KQT94492.1 hypothetical protein ASG49_06375 [Marmoricola sp. Leaf446]